MTEINLNNNDTEKRLVHKCSVVFKLMEHKVYSNKQKEIIWNFSTYSDRKNRTYGIYYAGAIEHSKNLIQVAQFQAARQGMRLVVVVASYTDSQYQESLKLNYCLVTMDTLLRFGNEMLEIKQYTQSDLKDVLLEKAA